MKYEIMILINILLLHLLSYLLYFKYNNYLIDVIEYIVI